MVVGSEKHPIQAHPATFTTVNSSDEKPMAGRHVVRRVGETEQRSVSSSTKLDEASVHWTARCHSHPHEFSVEVDKDDRGPSKVPVQSVPTWVDRDAGDESSSVSESCWSEMEDLNSDEDVEWGLTPPPGTVQTPSQI